MRNNYKRVLELFKKNYSYHFKILEVFDDTSEVRVRLTRSCDFTSPKRMKMDLLTNETPKAWTLIDAKRWGNKPRCLHKIIIDNNPKCFVWIIRPSDVAEYHKKEGQEIDYNLERYSEQELEKFLYNVDLLIPLKTLEYLL